MQTVKRSEARPNVCENEPSGPATSISESGEPAADQKGTGLHKITPSTLKSLKTSFEQTSGHCIQAGSFWQAGRLARGSVYCLRIFREVTLVLPRASIAFGNDLAEHFFAALEKLADRFDGNHGNHEGEAAKPKSRRLAIIFMVCVLMYCFNGLKSIGNINIISSSKNESKEDKVEKAVETTLAKSSEEVNNDDDESARPAAPKAKLPEKELKKAVLKKVVTEIVNQVLDSQPSK